LAPQAAGIASGCSGSSYEIASGRTLWKVYGPDLNGRFGGLQGTGGLEAVILDADGTTTGVINDQFGNGVASVSGGSVTWNTTRVGAYGPLPGVQAQTLTDVSQVAASTAWRSRRIDPTGFYWLGARYYEPTSGRFLSADPMGQAASPSLYDFCGGDPVNRFDPDGRCKTDLDNYLDQVSQNLDKLDSGGFEPFGTVHYGQYVPSPGAYDAYSQAMNEAWTIYQMLSTGPTADQMVMMNDPPFAGDATADLALGIAGGQLLGTALGAAGRVWSNAVDNALAPLSDMSMSPLGTNWSPMSTWEFQTVRLMGAMDDAIAQWNATGPTMSQADALINNPGLAGAIRGTQIDTFFKNNVLTDPTLGGDLVVTPRGQFGPDVFSPKTQQWWDVTTPPQWNAHANQYWLFGNGTPLFTK
jgi:RHS repeat-associated protein